MTESKRFLRFRISARKSRIYFKVENDMSFYLDDVDKMSHGVSYLAFGTLPKSTLCAIFALNFSHRPIGHSRKSPQPPLKPKSSYVVCWAVVDFNLNRLYMKCRTYSGECHITNSDVHGNDVYSTSLVPCYFAVAQCQSATQDPRQLATGGTLYYMFVNCVLIDQKEKSIIIIIVIITTTTPAACVAYIFLVRYQTMKNRETPRKRRRR